MEHKINILQLPDPEHCLSERWHAYGAWLSCQANPSLSYAEHVHLPSGDIAAVKLDFHARAGMELDDYIRLRRIVFLLSRSQAHSQYRGKLAVSAVDTPLGQMLAVFSDKGLCLLKFVEQKGVESELLAVQREKQALFVWREAEHLPQLREELAAYFSGSRAAFRVPLDLVGSDTQREVWLALRNIPHGETYTHAQQATIQGTAPRNVAAAAAQNKISIIIPDHRIKANEQGRNKELLAHERNPLPPPAAELPPPMPFEPYVASTIGTPSAPFGSFARSK